MEGYILSKREYSSRLGYIEDEQFQKALDRFDLGRLEQTGIIQAGLFGQNAFLTSTTGEYVLRGCPHYPWQFPHEQFFARLLHHETKVPVPWPYLIDDSPDIFGWSYAIMPRLQGISLDNEAVRNELSEQDLDAIDFAMGENLAELQKLTWPTWGTFELAAGTIVPIPTDYRTWVKTELMGWIDKAKQPSDRTTHSDEEWLQGLLDEAQDALKEPFQPTFVMRDYKPGNLLLQKTAGKWNVTGLFDLMECYFGDGEVDLSRYTNVHIKERPEKARRFIEGYLSKVKTPRTGLRERLAVYMLWDLLIIWEYEQRNVRGSANTTFRQWAEPHIDPLKEVVPILQ